MPPSHTHRETSLPNLHPELDVGAEVGKEELGDQETQESPTAFRNEFAHPGPAELSRTMGTWVGME